MTLGLLTVKLCNKELGKYAIHQPAIKLSLQPIVPVHLHDKPSLTDNLRHSDTDAEAAFGCGSSNQ